MARLNNEQVPTPKVPGVNIAGDFSAEGTDIAPEETIGLSPDDSEHMRAQREQVKRETLKASAQTQSTLGSNVTTNWPVDE